MTTWVGGLTKREKRFKRKEKARKARKRELRWSRLPWWRRLILRLQDRDQYYDPSYGTFKRERN